MSTRAELMTLIRLAPEVTIKLISVANLRILIGRSQIPMSLDGRALPRNEKVNLVANQREYVVSGASPVLTKDDFLGIDLKAGGVLYNDGSRWVGSSKEGHADGEFEPKTREWLDKDDVGWRERSASTASPQYWYLDTGEDNSSNLVVGLSEIPSVAQTDRLWIHYLSRGSLPTDDGHFLWTASTTQLVHLESYEILSVYWCLDYINRVILHNPEEANLYKQIFDIGIVAMANRSPLSDHLGREAFESQTPFRAMTRNVSGRRH